MSVGDAQLLVDLSLEALSNVIDDMWYYEFLLLPDSSSYSRNCSQRSYRDKKPSRSLPRQLHMAPIQSASLARVKDDLITPQDMRPTPSDNSMSFSIHYLFAVFDTFDRNKDEKISVGEIICCLQKLGLEIQEESLVSLVASIDGNYGGFMDFDQFAALYQLVFNWGASSNSDEDVPVDSEKEVLLDAFQVFDKNKDGFICSAELSAVLTTLGIEKGDDCQTMINRFDVNGDGRVDFAEFKIMMNS